MRIGTMFLGEVEELGGQSVQTKFFVLGVPLVPMGSYYFIGPGKGFEIPLHSKSMLLGYTRIGAWVGAVLFGAFAYLGRRSEASGLWIGFGVLLASAIVLTFLTGKLSKEERLRRALLQTITGIGAPASWLPAEMRTSMLETLESKWKAESGLLTWEAAIAAGKKEALLFAIAEYNLRPELATQALAPLQSADL